MNLFQELKRRKVFKTVGVYAAASLIMFTFAWNDYFFVSVLMMKNFTLPIYIAGGVDSRGVQFWFIAVRTMIAVTLPLILCHLLKDI